jgi:hypothetical protein
MCTRMIGKQMLLDFHVSQFIVIFHFSTLMVVGGSENRIESPNTRFMDKIHKSYEMETKNLQKTVLASKVVNYFTRALVPPFIWRRRDFYIPKIPSNLRNIPSVNMYMNVFYIP